MARHANWKGYLKLSLIAAKQEGKKPPGAPSPKPSNVINLMDALRRSAQAGKGASSSASEREASGKETVRGKSGRKRSTHRRAS